LDIGERINEFRSWINTGKGALISAGVCSVVILFGVGIFLFRPGESRAVAEELRKRGRNYEYLCKECGATGKVKLPYDQEFPIECPECGKQAAVKAFTCVGCGRIIEKRDVPYYRCPYCDYVYDKRLGPEGQEDDDQPPG
jgi:DNA-directed RNA polymerase subunit RPC12/RpoP